MSKYHKPTNQQQLISLLSRIGFIDLKVGKGSHQYKFIHPRIPCMCPYERPFVIVPHIVYKQFVDKVVKKLMGCYGFTQDELFSTY